MNQDFEQGFAAHQRGQLADAERFYDAVPPDHPNYFDALHLLGVVALQSGRTARAIELIGRAIAINPNSAVAHGNLASALRTEGRYADALKSYDAAIASRPDYATAHRGRGYSLVLLSRYGDALTSYDRALALRPDDAESHNDRGNVLRELSRHDEALASFDKAIALRPAYAETYNNRGITLRSLRRHDEALVSYDTAIALRPDYAEAHANRGNVLLDLDHSADALASYDRAIALQPDRAETHANRADALSRLDRREEALPAHDRAIALKPDDAVAYINRSIMLRRLNRHQEALADCDTAILLKPDYVEAHNIRGTVVADLTCHEEALVSYRRAIALNPDHAPSHYNQSFSLLRLGCFEEGWREYEWRKKLDKPIVNRHFPQPLWLGTEDIAHKTLFIYWEQGLGDTLQFCRYASLAEARGATVIMSVRQELHRLLERGTPWRIIGQNEVPPDFDYHCPMLSLPLAFRTTLETIPVWDRYISSETASRSTWEPRLPPRSKPRIGVVWSGRPTHGNDHNRSIDLQYLQPVFDFDAHWICLQKDISAKDAEYLRRDGRVTWFGDALTDFSDTAALVDQMDLLITADTSVAHLAGAMGKPVWILLPFNSDFRWLLNRTDSPWYPTARLFRQRKIGDWDSVIRQVRQALIAAPLLQNVTRTPPNAPIGAAGL